MESSIELIIQEFSEHNDFEHNMFCQLSHAASTLCLHECYLGNHTIDDLIENFCPQGWDKSIWTKMIRKPYEERIIIAAHLLGFEKDRLAYHRIILHSNTNTNEQ